MSHTPKKLGRFDVEEKLGSGGMGDVYLARDGVIDRKVAVKVLRPERLQVAADEGEDERMQAVRGFIQEARQLAKLERHKNILTVYEVDLHDGVPYIAMQLLEGGTLEDLLRQEGGTLSPDTQKAILSGVASALDYAHERGIYHCDVKPSNIMVDAMGQPYLMDFGISRAIGNHLGAKQHAFSGFTPLYASPEQVSGSPPEAASDIYSLGAVVYEMCAGRPPIEPRKDLSEMVTAIVQEEPKAPSCHNAWVSAELDAVILRALAKNPWDRHATVGEFRAAVIEALDRLDRYEVTRKQTSGPAIPDTLAATPRRPVRRRRLIATAVIVAAVGLCGYALDPWGLRSAPATAKPAAQPEVANPRGAAATPKSEAPEQTQTSNASQHSQATAPKSTPAPVEKKAGSGPTIDWDAVIAKVPERPPMRATVAVLCRERYGSDDQTRASIAPGPTQWVQELFQAGMITMVKGYRDVAWPKEVTQGADVSVLRRIAARQGCSHVLAVDIHCTASNADRTSFDVSIRSSFLDLTIGVPMAIGSHDHVPLNQPAQRVPADDLRKAVDAHMEKLRRKANR